MRCPPEVVLFVRLQRSQRACREIGGVKARITTEKRRLLEGEDKEEEKERRRCIVERGRREGEGGVRL